LLWVEKCWVFAERLRDPTDAIGGEQRHLLKERTQNIPWPSPTITVERLWLCVVSHTLYFLR